jgi:hypothetical protein
MYWMARDFPFESATGKLFKIQKTAIFRTSTQSKYNDRENDNEVNDNGRRNTTKKHDEATIRRREQNNIKPRGKKTPDKQRRILLSIACMQ